MHLCEGVATPLQLPEFPPSGPWDGYVLVVIWLPLALRILFLAAPFRKAIGKLAPHSGWALKQLRDLPVRGFGVLALNEVLAFSIPPLLVLLIRSVSDPIGWTTWGEVSEVGMGLLILSLFVWIFLDLLRIARVRRMLKAIERQDIAKLRKVADIGIKARSWLQKFSLIKPKPSSIDATEDESTGERVAKRSLKIWGTRALMARKLTPQGLLGQRRLSMNMAAKSRKERRQSCENENRQKPHCEVAQKEEQKCLGIDFCKFVEFGLHFRIHSF